jgi:hypothetical protein
MLHIVLLAALLFIGSNLSQDNGETEAETFLLRGRVVLPGGEPVAGAQVHLAIGWSRFCANGRPVYTNSLARSTVSREDGTFSFPIPESSDELRTPDIHSLRAEAPVGVSNLRRILFRHRETGIDVGDVVLWPPLDLSAEVLDPCGRPVQGAHVWVRVRPPEDQAVPVIGDLWADGKTDGRGRVPLPRIPHSEDWRIWVIAMHKDWVTEGTDVDLRPVLMGEPVRVRLAAGLTVRGRVLHRIGLPVHSLSVHAGRKTEDGPRICWVERGMTGKEGWFEIRGVPAENGLIAFRCGGRGPYLIVPVPTDADGGLLDLGTVLFSFAEKSLRFTVTVEGRAWRSVSASVEDEHGYRYYGGIQSADQRDYFLGCLPQGLYSVLLTVHLDDETSLEKVITGVRPGSRLAVTLSTASTLVLVFRDPNRPGEVLEVPDPEISVDGAPFREIWGAHRAIRLHLSPGLRQIRVRAEGHYSAALSDLVVFEDRENTAEVWLSRK